MKTVLKITATTLFLVLMLIVDIPILPVELVPEAQAILGVRRRTARRTAVIVHSADESAASAAASQQQAAPPQQQAAAAQSASGVPVGTVASALPAGCKAVTVGDTQYQDCGGSFYKTAFQGNNLVYVVVESPI